MLTVIIIGIFFAVLLLPIRHAFGLNLATTFLFIVPNGFDVTTYFFLIVLLRLLIIKISLKQKVKIDPFTILFFLLLFFATISYLLFQGIYGAEYLRRLFMTLVVIFLFVNIYNTSEDLNIFIKYIFVGVILLSTHLITQTLIPINPLAEAVFSSREGRLMPRGFANQYVNPNNIGALLVWGFGLIVGFYTLFYSKYIVHFTRRQKLKTFIWGILLLITVALLLGMLASRTNFFVLLFISLMVLFRLSFTMKSMRIIFYGSIFLFFIGPSILSAVSSIDMLPPNNIFAPLVNRLLHSETESEDVGYSRKNLAGNGLKLFLDNPLLGVGIGNEAIKMEEMSGLKKVSHNTFVSLLSEMGIIGLLFLVGIIGILNPYLKDDFAISIVLMIGVYGTFHNILLITIPWLILAFTRRSYDILKFENS